MRELFIIKDSAENRITFYHFVFFLAALPFDRIYSEVALISLFLHTLIHLQPRNITRRDIAYAGIPALLYLITCMGTMYSSFTSRAFFEWEIQLALIIFPFIFLVTRLDLKKYTVNLLFLFGLSCVITIVYLYINAIAAISYNHLPFSVIFSPAFINHNFSQPIDLHATYFSMYIAVCIPLFIHLWISTQKKVPRLIYSLCILILFSGLFQLASRSVLIAVLIIVCFVIPFFGLDKKWRSKFILVSLILSLLSGTLITRNDTFRSRYITELKGDLSESIININIVEPRWVRWQCASELIKTSPVIGHGSGSEIPLLKELYFSKGYYHSYINELNAHNQYLGIWIETGFIGLMVFLWILYRGFAMAIKKRDLFFCSFLVIVTVVSFSENILSVNKTIFFFAFFYSFFYSKMKLLQ